MKRLIPMRSGEEHDAFSRKARRMLCYLSKSRIKKAIKRQFNKRERKALRPWWDEYGLPNVDIDVPMPPCKPTKGMRPTP